VVIRRSINGWSRSAVRQHLFVDDVNFSENGSPMLFRIESGPIGISRNSNASRAPDFDFVMGVGAVTGNFR